MYGKGECLYDICEECRLGDKGIEVNPIYCLNCVLVRLGDIVENATSVFPKDEEEELDESRLN